ncbi:MAG: glycine cleavage T C-terminal barrel domain-containing protein [Actinomycetota bacterium]
MPLNEEVTFTFYVASWYRKSPYYAKTIEDGVKSFDIYNHMLIPTVYGDDVDEYWHLLNKVTMWDVGVERQVEITGPDAFDFTNRLTCRDLTRCEVDQCKYAPITADDGGIINDPILLRLADDHFWLSLADSDTLLWAKGVAVNSGMDVTIAEPDVSPMQIQGPRSKDVVRDLFGDSILDMKYYWCRQVELAGIPLVISRTGWSGEVGYELYLRDGSRGPELWDLVKQAGEPYEIRTVAPNDIRRMEAGIFNYNNDMWITDTPLEVEGMERLVEEQDADYIGKAALERQRQDGVTRKLTGAFIDGPPFLGWLVDFWPVRSGGAVVGRVTSACYSPRVEKNLAYVWLPMELAAPGTPMEIESPDGILTGTTTGLPFLDPRKDVPKG